VTGVFIEPIIKLQKNHPRFRRILSMIIDHAIMCAIIIPLIMLFTLILKSNIAFLGSIVIYFNKDFYRSRSLGKRILGYKIIDNKTGQNATELQCFIRNMPICLIWPIEVIISLFSPKRRIGDYLANTKVIEAQTEPIISILTEIKRTRFKQIYIWILLISVVYLYFLNFLI
jgi:uncharacterized RDD family membrane protein YckC